MVVVILRDKLVDSQLRRVTWLVASVGLIFAVAGCSSHPAESPSLPTTSGVTFDEYRAANLEFVACIESHGGTVKVNQIDNWGVPDISNTVTGPKLQSKPATAEYEAEIQAFQAVQDECDATTVGPTRVAYLAETAGTGQQEQTKSQRLKDGLPALRKCFSTAGADVDSTSTIDELRTAYHEAGDPLGNELQQCFIDLKLATDLGDGYYEIDF